MTLTPTVAKALALPPGLVMLTPKVAAQRLGVHVSLIYRAVSDGRLKAYRLAGSRLWLPEPAVLALLRPAA